MPLQTSPSRHVSIEVATPPFVVLSHLERASGRFGVPPAQLLAQAAKGRGPLSPCLSPLPHGAEALPGDVLVVRSGDDTLFEVLGTMGPGSPAARAHVRAEISGERDRSALLRPTDGLAQVAGWVN